MPYASIYPTNPRTNPWNFCKKILRIGGIEKLFFFWVGHFEFFCFIPMKTSKSLLVSKDGSKFWSSPTWQHFLTQTKHFEGSVNCVMSFFFKKNKFFCFIPMKTSQSLLVSKDGSKFWWLPWFPAKNHSSKHFSRQCMWLTLSFWAEQK